MRSVIGELSSEVAPEGVEVEAESDDFATIVKKSDLEVQFDLSMMRLSVEGVRLLDHFGLILRQNDSNGILSRGAIFETNTGLVFNLTHYASQEDIGNRYAIRLRLRASDQDSAVINYDFFCNPSDLLSPVDYLGSSITEATQGSMACRFVGKSREIDMISRAGDPIGLRELRLALDHFAELIEIHKAEGGIRVQRSGLVEFD